MSGTRNGQEAIYGELIGLEIEPTNNYSVKWT